uniref:Uncharacterized protein n=1 Tax=Rhizophora mucronata TaxID=61149 RepID=A0A2P2R021_RHIMU
MKNSLLCQSSKTSIVHKASISYHTLHLKN